MIVKGAVTNSSHGLTPQILLVERSFTQGAAKNVIIITYDSTIQKMRIVCIKVLIVVPTYKL